jgi:glycosyltransferase involved in cell wall biosynthesis
MGVLFVAAVPPWPVGSGNTQRMNHVISGLSAVGEVDVLNFSDPWRTRVDEPPSKAVRRWVQLDRPPVRGYARWIEALGPARKPLGVAGRRLGPATRIGMLDWAYDVVWVHRADVFALLEARLPFGPRVVDFDDLEDHKLAARARLVASEPGSRRWIDPLRTARTLLTRRDAVLWRRLQTQISNRVDAVVVTSQLDASRLAANAGAPVLVVPNGADDPGPEVPRPARGKHAATVVFFGLLTYPPNVDAAVFLAERVAPELRRRLPDLRVRFVGRASDRVKALHAPPEVEVTGFVEDLGAELAGADLALVPLRYGGGTRIKILDAWAHGLPVVATTVAAEGLEVDPGADILLADSPEALADACVKVLSDPALAASLAQQGRRRFEQSYQWREAEAAVASVARRVAKGTCPTAVQT